jgi:23S rRNA pseudouridine1911/1915/1917 synthase
MDLDIRYEDEDLIIINKPPNLVVHPAYMHFTGTLLNGLKHYVDNVTQLKDRDSRALLVHRIDKNTSGLLVVAKNEFTQERLSNQFFYHTIERRYIALVWGNVKDDEGTVVGNIGRSLKDRTKRDVFPDGDYGKHAVTHYKVIERLGYVSVIECKLETGRTHQIRVHMKHIGHPVFSDGPYGGCKIVKGTTFTKYKQFVENCFKIMPRQALHAKSLGFIHPRTQQEMFFEVDLPRDLVNVIRKWREYKQPY